MAAGSPSQADDPPDACALDGKAAGPCSITIALGDRPLARTFPFDVPVFLNGAAADDIRGLRLHVFTARQPFRLSEKCTDPAVPLEQCADAQRQLQCTLYETSKSQAPQSTWTFADLAGTDAKPENCSLQAQVSLWTRASVTDNTFSLRVPPQPANRYFALFLEVEKTPTAAQKDRLKVELAKAVETAVNDALSDQTGDPDAWFRRLHGGLCAAAAEAGRREGLRFEVAAGSLLDCKGTGKDQRLRETAHSLFRSLFNQRANIRFQLHSILVTRNSLSDAVLADLPTLGPLTTELGFDLTKLETPSFQFHIAFKPDLVPRLAADAAALRQAEAATSKAAGQALLAPIGSLGSSLEAYAKLQEITDAIAESSVILSGSTVGSFLTRQKGYLAADFGVLYALDVEEALPYLGTNVYFVPVNKQAPLGWRDGWRPPGKRLSVTVGATVGDFGNSRADPLVSDFNLVTGVGVRVTEAVRLGIGGVWFREKSANTLSSDKQTTVAPYLSFSIDYDVSSLINWFQKLIPQT